MKHNVDRDSLQNHSEDVYAQNKFGEWFGFVAVLLVMVAVAAVYYIKKCRPNCRKKKQRNNHSTCELNAYATTNIPNKRVTFQRSKSLKREYRHDNNKNKKHSTTPPLLLRLFFLRNKAKRNENSSKTRWNDVRYRYSALEVESGCPERLELERKARESALSVCRLYLNKTFRYELLRHLNDIGSRYEKHCFVVKDMSIKTERLLSLVPICDDCPIRCDLETRDLIVDLFQNLQHPYIYPVLDLEFTEASEELEAHAILITPFNTEGSLKDLIYESDWKEDWSRKYHTKTTGLPLGQIQRLGRQILEALLFLRQRGFAPYGHLHSGNVILQNGVARLAGLENMLLGYKSRIHQLVWRRVRAAPLHIDIICFGHVLFEMASGYELNQPEPSPGHLQLDLNKYPQVVDVLELIFNHPEDRYPSVEELLMCDLFRSIDLREMRGSLTLRTIPLSYTIRSLLDLVQRPKRGCNSEPCSPLTRNRRDKMQRNFSSDDCSLRSSQLFATGGVQHRELMLNLLTSASDFIRVHRNLHHYKNNQSNNNSALFMSSVSSSAQCLLAIR